VLFSNPGKLQRVLYHDQPRAKLVGTSPTKGLSELKASDHLINIKN